MRYREYYPFLELNNGTEIRHSALKYSGVYFQCTTPDKKQPSGYKRAVTCWPDCIEPLRFFDVEGYSTEELEMLREHIEKNGDAVVSMLQKKAKELEQAIMTSMRANSTLIVLDAQQVGGFVAAFLKYEREVFQYKVKLKISSFEEKLFLYGSNDLLKATFSLFYEVPNVFLLKCMDIQNRFFVQNDGDEEIMIKLSSSRKIRLQPGERKLISKETMEEE